METTLAVLVDRHRSAAGVILRRFAIGIIVASAFFSTAWILGRNGGRDIPTAPPQEANRILHPNGFSIVNPSDWKSKLSLASDPFLPPGIFASPQSSRVARRYGASLSVTQVPTDRVDLGGFAETQFQGQPAHKRVTTRDGSFMDDPPAMSYTLCFQRHDIWFEIRYSIFDSYDDLPAMIASYVNTFRYTKRAGQ